MSKFLLAMCLGVLALAFGTAVANAATISAKQSTLDEHQGGCLDAGGVITGWHFVINQVEPASNAPATITVEWSNGDTQDVPLDRVTGKVAHYNVDATDTHTEIVSATANIYSGWSGNFNLSSVECEAPADACTEFGDRIVIRFDVLLGQGQDLQESSDPLPIVIPAGTYTVTLQSFDDHVGHPGQTQNFEQWFASIETSTGTVETNAISDIPPEPETTVNEQVGTITLTSPSISVTAVHLLAGQTFPSPESVLARCVALDPVD